MRGPVDIEALHAALDRQRRQRDISWRQVGREIEVSQATFSRTARGHGISLHAFVAMTGWLGVPAERFIRR